MNEILRNDWISRLLARSEHIHEAYLAGWVLFRRLLCRIARHVGTTRLVRVKHHATGLHLMEATYACDMVKLRRHAVCRAHHAILQTPLLALLSDRKLFEQISVNCEFFISELDDASLVIFQISFELL